MWFPDRGEIPRAYSAIALLVNLMRGMEAPNPAVLPLFRIGSTANETTGMTVVLRPHSRKRNQYVMNRHQSTSIWGNDYPETEGEPDPRRNKPLLETQDEWVMHGFGFAGALGFVHRAKRGKEGKLDRGFLVGCPAARWGRVPVVKRAARRPGKSSP